MAEKKANFKESLKKLKHKEIIVAVVAVAVMLLIYFSSLDSGKISEETTTVTTTDYCSEVREEIRLVVAKMSGDKKAEVIISWESGVEEIIAYTTSQNGNSINSSPTIVSSSGEGKPIVLKEVYPKALGVIVVFDGAENTKLKIEVMNMVSTLLGISPEKVAVYETK